MKGEKGRNQKRSIDRLTISGGGKAGHGPWRGGNSNHRLMSQKRGGETGPAGYKDRECLISHPGSVTVS